VAIEGILAAGYQHRAISNAPGYDDGGRGAVLFQPVLSFQLTEKDTIQAKFGFASGNGLNGGSTPFAVVPWAADLEADVKNINGRDRDYLLTAWYGRTISIGGGMLAVSGGIIDATDYLDDNAYANDELTQFMNEALVNAPNAFLPSYDKGAAAQWDNGPWSARAVVMGIGGNDDQGSYTFFGAQVGYTLQLGFGEGHYRLNVNGTSDDFDSSDDSQHALFNALVSCDQQLGDGLGVWVRIGRQDDAVLIDFETIVSGGINILGNRWGRAADTIGIGYASLYGGNGDFDHSDVFEVYYRCAINAFAAISLDLQYIKDKIIDAPDPRGWIGGIRFAASF
jgi:porin